MKTVEYFKLQAKNLHKDFKTQKPLSEKEPDIYDYSPRYFDVNGLVIDFDLDEDSFALMNAQHVIAQLAGFRKWTDMLKASPAALALSQLLFDNMHKISVEEWNDYIAYGEKENNATFDDETKLEIFTNVWLPDNDLVTLHTDYRISPGSAIIVKNERPRRHEPKQSKLITSLPLADDNRKEFIETANSSFERVFDRIEPENSELVRKMWDAEKYINEDVLTPDKLPIDRDYALSLVDALMVGYVIQLAVEADEQA